MKMLTEYSLVREFIIKASFVKMPKGGKKGGHKGRMRTYTSPEEIDAQMKAEKERKKQEQEQEELEEGGAAQNETAELKLPASGSDDSDDENSQRRRAGVEGLIEIENPNRMAQKSKKVTQIELDEPKQLSRREREEIEKQKAKERYMKMHLAGKTDQAKADLARLAIIRKQREDAAKKKEEEKKGEHLKLGRAVNKVIIIWQCIEQHGANVECPKLGKHDRTDQNHDKPHFPAETGQVSVAS
uniref:Casein kinase substrate phosphoprotein PP28 domain-containing protein n=2 Tax=Monopterus albus TaxID=43700 RepID=A0A3Q3JG21_MONAL